MSEPKHPIISLEPTIWWDAALADMRFHVIARDEGGTRYSTKLVIEDAIGRHGVISAGDTASEMGHANNKQFLQQLVDEAYRAGIRPTPDVADSDARRKHLDDMRAIAFHQLKMERK